MAAGVVEYLVEASAAPNWKGGRVAAALSCAGLALALLGEGIRKAAMVGDGCVVCECVGVCVGGGLLGGGGRVRSGCVCVGGGGMEKGICPRRLWWVMGDGGWVGG
jgi:hypothetical protein